MAEGTGRSAEEREAARLERERRRAMREARAIDPPPAHAIDPPPAHAIDPPPAHAIDPPPAHATDPPSADGDEMLHTDGTDLFGETDEHEVPVGTKRVSRGSRISAVRHRREAPPPEGSRGPRRRLRAVPSRAGRVFAVVALVLAAALIWFLVELFQPFYGSGHGTITVTIPPRSTSSQVGNLLERDGVVSSAFFFELRATLAGERGSLRAGAYHLKLGMPYGDVLKILTTAPPPIPTTTLTLIEGKSRQQVNTLLRSQGIVGSYLAASRHSSLLDPTRYGAPRNTPDLEGFLFPSTYQLRKPVNVRDLVNKQLTTFKQAFAKVNLGYARSHNLTPYDVLIVASIIEDEAATAHDRPLVASVVYNRLKSHIPLGMDSTTRYEFNDWTTPLTSSQLAAHSPYNTRLNAGLPPTPIGNPGLAAIQAAANPAQTNYLYFVVKPCGNGASVFTSSYAQFLTYVQQYQTARAKRGGKSPVSCP